MSKKKNKKGKHAAEGLDLESEVKRLRKENEELRARLEKIGELVTDLPGDDEREEHLVVPASGANGAGV